MRELLDYFTKTQKIIFATEVIVSIVLAIYRANVEVPNDLYLILNFIVTCALLTSLVRLTIWNTKTNIKDFGEWWNAHVRKD